MTCKRPNSLKPKTIIYSGYLVISSLAEETVQPALLRHVAADDDDGDEGEGGAGLPDLHPVGTDQDEDDEQPDVGEEGEDHGDDEDRVGLDPPRLACRQGSPPRCRGLF